MKPKQPKKHRILKARRTIPYWPDAKPCNLKLCRYCGNGYVKKLDICEVTLLHYLAHGMMACLRNCMACEEERCKQKSKRRMR